MIAQLRGTLISKTSTDAVIDCSGVGYIVFVSVNTSERLPAIGAQAFLHTLLIPREDAFLLYGFADVTEREAFKLLISISGIGPKIALAILSSLNVNELKEIIFRKNIIALQKLPGIGKKTAERIILELGDKISKLGDSVVSTAGYEPNLIRQEAISALVTLGYSNLDAEKAIKKVLSDNSEKDLSAEQLIKVALKFALR